MEIIKINSQNRYFLEIMNLYYKWWGKTKNQTLQEITEYYKNNLNSNNKLPIIYALIINDTLIGMYEINQKDDINTRDYTPYLANVYILENYRHQKYSSILINDSFEKVKKLGFNFLYLHSTHKNYYEKYGFKHLENVSTSYGTKKIYVKEL